MAFPAPPSYTTPIPNDPFYYPPSYYIAGTLGPLVLGSGLSVNYTTGTLDATGGGGGGGVSSISGGTGILVSAPTGNVVVTNTGVTSLIAGSGISLTANTGSILISSTTSGGSVTTVTAGSGLAVAPSTASGGNITTSGTLQLANSGVIAGSYTNANITVDLYGRITNAANGGAITGLSGTLPISVTTGSTPVVSIAAATTTNSGAVQLSDSTSNTSSTEAATSLAVKTAFDVATAAIPKSCLTGCGGLVTSTATGIPVALARGTNDYLLTADSSCAEGIKWAPNGAMATTGGTFTGDVTFYGGVPGGTITSIGNFVPGDGYTGNLGWIGDITGGSGSGATGSASSDGNGDITTFTITGGGTGYTVGDPISINAFTSGTPVSAIVTGVTPTVPGAGIIDCSGSLGIPGQVLTSTTFGTVEWNTPGGSPATPTTEGVLYGCSASDNVSVGRYALTSLTTGYSNTALGCEALYSMADGADNVAIGMGALVLSVSGCQNTAIGTGAMYFTGAGSCNVAVGQRALYSNDTGNFNVVVGNEAGCDITTGDCNIAIGPGVQVPTGTGSCQLALGFGAADYWLTGDSTKAIKPGAGIIDGANSCGTAGQALLSTGSNGVVWGATGMPGWTDAGAMTIGATVTAPPFGNVGTNKIYYRQLGNKEYEVVYILKQGAPAGSSGSGDYLFTLPAGLQFDTTLAFQPAVSFSGPNSSWLGSVLPGDSLSRYVNGTGDAGVVQPLVYDATRFRLVGVSRTVSGSTIASTYNAIGSSFFPLSAGFGTYINVRFQFTST